MIRVVCISVLCVWMTGCIAIERATLPDAVSLGSQWEQSSATQQLVVDHDPWDTFLARYLSTDAEGINRLDYDSVTEEDEDLLTDYLDALQQINTQSLTRDQQLAYWINLYNAKTVDLILEEYPVDSILEVSDGIIDSGPWTRKVVSVDNSRLSLHDIEHRIVRPVYEDERIHYALNCAARSCPNLAPQAWRADGLDQALQEAERAYVNDPRGVTITSGGGIILSKIYVWFKEDFGNSEAEVLESLAEVAEPELQEKLQGRTSVRDYVYDWTLNDTEFADDELASN